MSYNGTKLGQDIRFKDPDKDILLSMKTPKIFSTTVSKQNIIILPIIKLWLNQQIFEFLEFEDETLVNLIINLINSSSDKIDPKNMQYQISGFLGDKTYSFMKKFWKLLISVQECFLEDKLKIPSELIPLKIEYDKQQSYKKFERYKEYENNYNIKNNNKYNNDNINDNEDKTKIELMEIIDSYKKDERYKNKYKEKSRSRSRSHEKRKYHKSKSKSHERKKGKEKKEEYYKYKSNSKNKRRHKRYKSNSSSSYDNSDVEKRKYRKEHKYKYENKKRKYSKDYSDSENYDYHIKKHYHDNKKEYNYKKHNKSISSSDSSETFKI